MDIILDLPNLTIQTKYNRNLGMNFKPIAWTGIDPVENLRLLKIVRENFDKVRLEPHAFGDSPAALSARQLSVTQAKTLNFKHVMFGSSTNAIPQTNSALNGWINQTMGLAQFAVDNGVHEFQVVNELGAEFKRARNAVVSQSTPANRAKVTIAEGHDYTEGQLIEIYGVTGANQAQYNGVFPIINVTPTTFEYVMSGNVVTAPGGSHKIAFPRPYLRNLTKTLAQQIKNAFPQLEVSASIAQGGEMYDWLTETDFSMFDKVHLNTYGNNETDVAGFIKNCRDWINKFGSKAGFTEVSMQMTNWATTTITKADQAKLIEQRLEGLFNLNPKADAYFFTFHWFATGNPWGVYFPTGEFHPIWDLIRTRTYRFFYPNA